MLSRPWVQSPAPKLQESGKWPRPRCPPDSWDTAVAPLPHPPGPPSVPSSVLWVKKLSRITSVLSEPTLGSYPIRKARIPKALGPVQPASPRLCQQLLTCGSAWEAGGDPEVRAVGAATQRLCKGEQNMAGEKLPSLGSQQQGPWVRAMADPH